jgi:hypothetical protein
MFHDSVLEEILEEKVASNRGRHIPRGVKRKMSAFPLRPRGAVHTPRLVIENHIQIFKRTLLGLGYEKTVRRHRLEAGSSKPG